jgi:carboxypeptidase C (cathepsin A)
MQKRCWLMLVLLTAFLTTVCPAADDPPPKPTEKPPDAKPKPDKSEKAESEEKKVETRHSVLIGGKKIDYMATAGTILLRDNENKPTATIFYIAYTRDGVEDRTKRPITYCFNGGPGSSSVWLQMGLLGPRRVHLAEDGSAVPPPYHLVDNEYSLLDETDLVFIDPVSTGFSRSIKPEDARKFHGVQEDIRSVAEFIRLYTTRNARWDSPKFIIGESYGTTRAAGLSGELRDRERMAVNGIMLLSTVLNFETLAFSPGNDLPYILYLPSYTAVAWFHKKLPEDLQRLPLHEVLEKAESFAAGEYNRALLLGANLPADTRRQVVNQLARLTGLSESYVERANLRVSLSRFAEELLRDEGRVLGRFDGRYTGYVRDRLGARIEYDPSAEAVFSAFNSTFNQYVRTELKFESDLFYELLTGSVNPWNWGEQNAYLNVAETLADSLTRNPFLKVEVCSGYFDLATPYFATRYTFDHLEINPALLKSITHDHYLAGHMMYLNLPDLKKQKADLARFIQMAAAP